MSSTSNNSDGNIEKYNGKQRKAQARLQDHLIIIGDFRAKAGEGREENMVGAHELCISIEILAGACHTNNHSRGNTWLQQPTRRQIALSGMGDLRF